MIEEFVGSIVENEDTGDECCGVEAENIPVHGVWGGRICVTAAFVEICTSSVMGVGRFVVWLLVRGYN